MVKGKACAFYRTADLVMDVVVFDGIGYFEYVVRDPGTGGMNDTLLYGLIQAVDAHYKGNTEDLEFDEMLVSDVGKTAFIEYS